MSIQFRTRQGEATALGRVLAGWWQGLEDDRGSRAMLRRAATVTAVTLSAPYQRLFRRLCEAGWPEDMKPFENDRLAVVAGLLAHVKETESRPLANAMSQRDEGGDRPRLSELRFRRLLESADLDSLYAGLRRALPLMKHQADVLALANDVLHWGDAVQKRWAYDYDWPDKSKS